LVSAFFFSLLASWPIIGTIISSSSSLVTYLEVINLCLTFEQQS
jgi:hypothetical protein